MAVPEYYNTEALSFQQTPDLGSLRGKSVVITGGASGLGKAYAAAFAKAGAFVTVGDLSEVAGKQTVEELSGNGQYCKCDIREWNQQVDLFEAAAERSPHKSVDIVIANAGIVGQDDLYDLEDPALPPKKPSLRILDVNLMGTAYTVKLALHYFRRQALASTRDRCLIIKGSIAAYADQPGSPQYNASKWALRGLMRNLRRTAWKENIRVNLVCPWYVKTPILAEDIQDYLVGKGVEFATVEDATSTMLTIATDLSMNGRSLGVVPRREAPLGYMDLDHDDYREGDFLMGWQQTVLDTSLRLVEKQ